MRIFEGTDEKFQELSLDGRLKPLVCNITWAHLTDKTYKIDRTYHWSDISEIGHFRDRTFQRQDISEIGHFRDREFQR